MSPENENTPAGASNDNAPRLRLTLRLVATVDFRHGMPFHYDELRRRKLLRKLGGDETIMLISQTGRQVAFLFQAQTVHNRRGAAVHAIAHYRIQLDRHTGFSPLMLAEYAELAGIELTGIKRFEDHIAERAA